MVSAMTKAINKINLFTQNSKQEMLKSQKNPGHFQRDCRASDKSRRQNNRRSNVSLNHQ